MTFALFIVVIPAILFIDIYCIRLMFMSYLYSCYLYSLTHAGVKYDFHITWCSWCFIVTRRVPLVEQKLITLPDRLDSSPVFVGFDLLHFAFSVYCFVDYCLCLYPVYFWTLYGLSSSIYGFRLPLHHLKRYPPWRMHVYFRFS